MKKFSLFFLVVFTCITFGQSDEYTNAANILAGNGYIVDQSSDPAKYNINKTILRQEAIGIITKVNGLVGSGDTGYVCQNKFLDVSVNDGWVCYVAESAASNGVVNPNNARFRPKDNMTRFEAMILAFKGSCMQPIDETSNDNAQDQVKTFAINTGLITSTALDINAATTRGEFFSYIVRAQNYKTTHPEVIDSSLPGCVAFKNVVFEQISVKIPEYMEQEIEDPEVENEQSYSLYGTPGRITLGVYSSEGMNDIKSILQGVHERNALDMPEYKLLQDYAWRGGRINVVIWQQPNTEGKTKIYDYSILKNNTVYSVIFIVDPSKDTSTKGVRDAVFNSVQIETLGQGATS